MQLTLDEERIEFYPSYDALLEVKKIKIKKNLYNIK